MKAHIDYTDDYEAALSGYLMLLKATRKNISIEEIKKEVINFKKEWQNRSKMEAKAKARKVEEEKRCEVATEAATRMDLPMDWENIFEDSEKTQGVRADTPADALILSINNLGYVDIEYMSAITGLEYKEIITALKGSIIQNPEKWEETFFKGWETKDEYLSGNLKYKWNIADTANRKYKGYFEDNLKAIEEVMPPSVTSKDIYITLGSPWVPTDIIDDFIVYLFGKGTYISYRDGGGCQFDEVTGTWYITDKSNFDAYRESARLYGTSKINAIKILEKTLNGQDIEIYNNEEINGKKIRKFNPQDTAVALEKQKMMIKAFKSWVWRSDARRRRLEDIFANRYSCIRTRNYDGSFLQFPNMSKDVTLYKYQKDAVARIIFSPNTLLAHDVGSGKTYVMIAAGMELRRMGLSKKNLYVVPNNIIGQWRKLFKTLYPTANILCIEPKDFTPAKREGVLQDIKYKDYDAIIMGYGSFGLIPLSAEYYLDKLKEERDSIKDANARHPGGIPELETKLKKIGEKTAKLLVEMIHKKNITYFDDLGITRLFVDEAHNFKNVPVETNSTHIYGIGKTGSQKCNEMYEKVKFVQRENKGGGVVFATGTPITNSLTDLFVMQKYLQDGVLSTLDIGNFDNWVGMFAESSTEFEVDVDTTKFKMKRRFSKFHNLPELTSLLSLCTDFHHNLDLDEIPEFKGYTDVMIDKTKGLANYISKISKRADRVRAHTVDSRQDNMLKITTDGRKAALDLRLVEHFVSFGENFKVESCSKNVAQIYKDTEKDRSTQIIFCDISVPSDKFNLYTDMSKRLQKLGVKGEEIAFIHSANTEKEREKLFERVRQGEIRVLMGSTFKLGLGVNVQDKLIAVHHLDVPWRPSDMVQREGRILRPGNTNKEIQIFRYITKGSFDAYSWQLLETKQSFINALLSGFVSKRSENDVDDTVLNYAEVKALAVDNPLLKERIETANELRRNITLRERALQERESMEIRLENLPEQIDEAQEKYNNAKLDLEIVKQNKTVLSYDEKKILGQKILDALNSNLLKDEETDIFDYRGFKLVAPKHIFPDNLIVSLKGAGKYGIKLGNSDVGAVLRIDNFIKDFTSIVDRYNRDLKKLKADKVLIESKLELRDGYSGKIERLKAKLKKLDKELGVEENERS